MLLKRHELWRRQYRARRYLENAADEELAARGSHLVANAVEVTKEEKIGLIAPERGGAEWMVLFTHWLEENKLRGRPHHPDEQLRLLAPMPPRTPLKDPTTNPTVRPLIGDRYLLRFGKLKYMRALFDDGEVRLAPASTYADPSLDPSRFDPSEREIRTVFRGEEGHIQAFDGKTGAAKGRVRPIGNVELTERLHTDFLVLCLCDHFSWRLWADFPDSEACVLIHDPQVFLDRLFEAIDRGLLPEWGAHAQSVHYVDPYNDVPNRPQVPFAKHFKFAYQREFRVVALPQSAQEGLDPIMLRLGPLSDCAVLVER